MSKKKILPDSLELLLDTMCNTFGGIMFIAISLVVVSQLISKQQLDMSAEAKIEAAMAQVQKNVETIQTELLDLRKKALELQFRTNDSSPEKKSLVVELYQVRQKNIELLAAVESVRIREMTETNKKTRLNLEISDAKERLEQKVADTEKQAMETAKQKQETLKQIAELEKELKNLKPRNLRFSMETSTRLKPYWVIFKDNKLYRLGMEQKHVAGEVDLEDFDAGKRVRLIPRKGTALSEAPEAELDYLFDSIDKKQCFISLLIDEYSFSAFMLAKQYWRDKGFRVYWGYNPKYELVYSANIDYRASE